MGSLNRRTLMVAGAAATTAVCAECLSDADETRDPKTTSGTPHEREYDAENPFSILLMNDDDGDSDDDDDD